MCCPPPSGEQGSRPPPAVPVAKWCWTGRCSDESGGKLMYAIKDELAAELDALRADGTYKQERSIASPQSAHISAGAIGAPPAEVLNFCANNYLGLADHPDIITAAHRALDERGFGMASVRF